MKVKKLAIALVCASVVFGLTACGGGNDSPVSESMNSSSNQTEKDESVAAEEDESVADSPANDREFILQLIQAFMPGDTVPESFLECWVDETATASGLTFAEIRNEVLLGEEDSILDEYSEQVVVTCLATLSEEDFVAVMASGILDDDDNEVDENPDAEPDFDRNQKFPDELAPDLVSNPAFADPGIQIIVSPGIVDGYLWEGTISGSGFTPGETVRLVGCDATYETFVETFLFSCDFEEVTILGDVDEDGSFTSEPLGPIPTGTANGTCAMIGTDPDNNPDTKDGQGAVVCTR